MIVNERLQVEDEKNSIVDYSTFNTFILLCDGRIYKATCTIEMVNILCEPIGHYKIDRGVQLICRFYFVHICFKIGHE